MIKKFLFVFLILVFILLCYSVYASEYIDTVLPGKWNIYGVAVDRNHPVLKLAFPDPHIVIRRGDPESVS